MTDFIKIPRILLPKTDNMQAWSVIACDQFTSDREYWETLERQVGDNPSTLRLILPEVYLKDGKTDERIKDIHLTMKKYLADGLFKRLSLGFILVERTTEYLTSPRFGLMAEVDLEAFSEDFHSGKPIRSTEKTVSDRLPARKQIRRGSAIELSHSMMLYDDPENYVIGELVKKRNTLPVVYDFDLNMNGGRLKGYLVPFEESKLIKQRFYDLAQRQAAENGDGLFFAVGDGNHSMVAAKEYWEELKEDADDESNPAFRYVLTEICNIYDKGVSFEPIHRFIKIDNKEKFLERFESYTAPYTERDGLITFDGFYSVTQLLRRLDSYAKAYISMYGGKLDYIYSVEELKRLVNDDENAVGVVVHPIDKDSFFKHMRKRGAFPQKTFTTEKGTEKRYYLECKENK